MSISKLTNAASVLTILSAIVTFLFVVNSEGFLIEIFIISYLIFCLPFVFSALMKLLTTNKKIITGSVVIVLIEASVMVLLSLITARENGWVSALILFTLASGLIFLALNYLKKEKDIFFLGIQLFAIAINVLILIEEIIKLNNKTNLSITVN